jgi:hypothetical protein
MERPHPQPLSHRERGAGSAEGAGGGHPERTIRHAAVCRRIDEVLRWPRLIDAELETWGTAETGTVVWGGLDGFGNVCCSTQGSDSAALRG